MMLSGSRPSNIDKDIVGGGALNKSLERKLEVKESISGEKTSNEGKEIDSGWVS